MDKNRQQFEQELEKLLSGEQIRKEELLSRHTTFRVGGAAEYFVTPTIEQVPKVVELCRQYEMPLTVMGNGSNLLVSDDGLRGVVMEIGKAASGIRILDDEDLAVAAGTLLSETAHFAARHGLAG
ncbi:MAG: FAD-binding protein, partial [Lachnospiraceae bacterium]|nr:FAD-binding protein [bacterium]MDY5517603.1 FAD-binding protein [Lachnospiraceae bacterium]